MNICSRKKEVIRDCLIESHDLSQVLKNGTFAFLSSRNTFFNNNFAFVQPRKIRQGYNTNGSECFCEYNKIQEVLYRLFEDDTVYQQYLSTDSLHDMQKFNNVGGWRGDFFTSPIYRKILQTVPKSEADMPPILIGLYRKVIFRGTININFLVIII